MKKEHITVRLTPQNFCKNCEGIVYDKFCSSCGQRYHQDRMSFGVLLEEAINKFLMLDSSTYRTLLGLVKPGKVIREYISGQRKKYMRPISFFLLVLAIYIYLQVFVEGIPIVDFSFKDRTFDGGVNRALEWFTSQIKLILIFSLPLFAYYTFIAFKQMKFNYYEHVVFWLYVSAYTHLLSIANTLLQLIFKGHLDSTDISFATDVDIWTNGIYAVYAIIQFFQLYSFKGVIKALWTAIYCFLLLLLILVFGVSLILGLIDYLYINPAL